MDDRREARAEGGRRFQREGAITAKDLDMAMVHSFIPDIYIAPLQETYSEALSVLRHFKEKCLKKLAERRHDVLR